MRVFDGEDEQGRPARYLEPDPNQEPVRRRIIELRIAGSTVRSIQSKIMAEFEEHVALATIAKISNGANTASRNS